MSDRRGKIDGDYVREFYRLWSAGAGYCNPLGTVRKLIAPVKKRLMRILTYLAKRRGWVYGIKQDVIDRDYGQEVKRVLYFDTPFGQASFHLLPHESTAAYPQYTGDWSGVRNSDEVLASLFESFHS